jgi:hypothetical protein
MRKSETSDLRGFPKRSCSIKELKHDDDSTESHRALGCESVAYVKILGAVLGSDCGADIADGEVRPPDLEYCSGKKAFLDQCPTSKCQSLSSDELPAYMNKSKRGDT